MTFNVLAVGDVVGNTGLSFLSENLRQIIRRENIAFTIVNGENASMNGVTAAQAEDIFAAGADVITLGNHTFSRKSILDYLDENRYILRPANFAPQSPGRGYGVYETTFGDICVISLIGRCNMAFGPDNPFLELERILKKVSAPYIFIDFHAEATSEKLAMCHMADGRITALFGTHTHVQTSDGCVFPNGTGYISDLGMTGSALSVIGVKPQLSISSFMGNPPVRYEDAGGSGKMECAVFTVDSNTKKCTSVRALRLV